jgi:hypothetical protein
VADRRRARRWLLSSPAAFQPSFNIFDLRRTARSSALDLTRKGRRFNSSRAHRIHCGQGFCGPIRLRRLRIRCPWGVRRWENA